jgi:hypothetical protein
MAQIGAYPTLFVNADKPTVSSFSAIAFTSVFPEMEKEAHLLLSQHTDRKAIANASTETVSNSA